MSWHRWAVGLTVCAVCAGTPFSGQAATQRDSIGVSVTVVAFCTADVDSAGQISHVHVSCGQQVPYSLGFEGAATAAAPEQRAPFDGATRSYTLSVIPGTSQSFVTATITY